MSNINVLLIYPPFFQSKDNPRSKAGPTLPPLGLLYLAAYARKEYPEIDIKVLDSPALRIGLENLESSLSAFCPSVVGITVNTITFSAALKTAEIIKKLFPACIIIVGGPHASILPEEFLASPHIDMVVIGEGEETFAELLECLLYARRDISSIPNIVYKKNGRIVHAQLKHRPIDLDNIPLPARDLVDMKVYHPTEGNYKRLPATNMITSRGCPYKCSFCSKNIFGTEYREQPPEKTIEEIEILIKDYAIKEIVFYDDVFTLNKKRTELLCDLLMKKRLDITWSCSTRVNLVDPQLLSKMRDSGCVSIGYGMEVGDPHVLQKITKGFSAQEARKAVQWTKNTGMDTRAFYIIGYIGETIETIKKTIDLSLELNADFVIYNFAIPLPGTELYDEAKRNNLLMYEGIELYNKGDGAHPLIKLNGVSSSSLIKLYKLVYIKYYIRLKYVISQIRRIKSVTDVKRYFKGFISLLRWCR
ncbi:MAG: radical SAM protein [Candidatus Omnitrophota bacterium]